MGSLEAMPPCPYMEDNILDQRTDHHLANKLKSAFEAFNNIVSPGGALGRQQITATQGNVQSVSPDPGSSLFSICSVAV